MSFFGKLFGTEKGVEKLTDGIYNGVDKAFFTDEEKVDAFKEMLKLYEPFKLAQRYMMMIIGIPFVLIHTIAASIQLVIAFMGNNYMTVSDNINASLSMFNEALGTPFVWIAAFYFGGGAVGGIVEKARGKK